MQSSFQVIKRQYLVTVTASKFAATQNLKTVYKYWPTFKNLSEELRDFNKNDKSSVYSYMIYKLQKSWKYSKSYQSQ